VVQKWVRPIKNGVKEILNLVNKWRAVNCSQEGYGILADDLEEREKNETMMKEYNAVWERRFFAILIN